VLSPNDNYFPTRVSSTCRILYPNRGGNIHEFQAITDCALFDVLSPSYNEYSRPCSYYNPISTVKRDKLLTELNTLQMELPVELKSHGDFDVLFEGEPPQDFYLQGLRCPSFNVIQEAVDQFLEQETM